MTLIEVILVVSITAILAGAGATTYFQVMKGSGMSNNRAEAISSIERAADLFTIDALQMQGRPKHREPAEDIPRDPATPVVPLDWPITLSWIDDTEKDEDENPIIKYVTVEYDYDEANKQFTRTEEIIIDEVMEGSTTTVIRNISSAGCQYNWMEDIFYLTIQATVGQGDFDTVTEERSYEIIPRTNLS